MIYPSNVSQTEIMPLRASQGACDPRARPGEHMPDKAVWLSECHRVLRPGGRLLIATWVHRATTEPSCDHRENRQLALSERALLDKICRYYALPAWVELADYQAAASALRFSSICTADWSAAVAPFWPAVWRSALTLRGVRGLIGSLRRGMSVLRGARAVRLMVRGFKQGTIRLGLITCKK
jgi:tocopherol O-methyltransferase